MHLKVGTLLFATVPCVMDSDHSFACADTGHSLAAQYQLADCYVGDLPLIERVVGSNDDESTESEDDEKERDQDRPHQVSRPNEDTVRANVAQEEERPRPRVSRFVANRYRRSGDEANPEPAGGPNDENDLRPQRDLSPPRFYSANSWKMFLDWRIVLAMALIFAPKAKAFAVSCGWAIASLGRSFANACWKRRMWLRSIAAPGLTIAVAVALGLYLRGGGTGSSHPASLEQNFASSKAHAQEEALPGYQPFFIQEAKAPPGHNPDAVLYF